jgi:hypothetical protein
LNKLFFMLKYIHQHSFTNISHFLFRSSCIFSFRTSVIFPSEHPSLYVPNIMYFLVTNFCTTFIPNIRPPDFLLLSHSEHPVIPPDVRKSRDEKGQARNIYLFIFVYWMVTKLNSITTSSIHVVQSFSLSIVPDVRSIVCLCKIKK